jgi:hypothetical protein
MAAIADTYSFSDPVQDGSQLPPPSVAADHSVESEDHSFSLNDVIDADVDLDSLFGDSRSEIFNLDLISDDQIFDLKTVASRPDNSYNGSHEPIYSGNDGPNTSALSSSSKQYQDSTNARPTDPPKLTLPSDPPRRAYVLTLPKAPPRLPDSHESLCTAGSSVPQVVLAGTPAQTPTLTMGNQTYSPQGGPQFSLARSVAVPRRVEENVSVPGLSPQSLTTVTQQSQPMYDQPGWFGRHESPGSTDSSFYSACTPSDARVTPELPTTVGVHGVSEYNSSVKSWALQVGSDTGAGTKNKARKNRSDKLPKSYSTYRFSRVKQY